MSNPKEEEAANADVNANGDTKVDEKEDGSKDEPMTDAKPPAASDEAVKKEDATSEKEKDTKKAEKEPSEDDYAEEDDVDKEEEELFCSLEQAKAKEEQEHAGDKKVAPTLLKEVLEKGELEKSPEAAKQKIKGIAEKASQEGSLVSGIFASSSLQLCNRRSIGVSICGKAMEWASSLKSPRECELKLYRRRKCSYFCYVLSFYASVSHQCHLLPLTKRANSTFS